MAETSAAFWLIRECSIQTTIPHSTRDEPGISEWGGWRRGVGRGAVARYGLGATPKCRVAPQWTYWSRIRKWVVQNFQTLIVLQHLYIMSAKCFSFEAKSSRPSTGFSPLDPTGELPSPDPLGYSPPNENSWPRPCVAPRLVASRPTHRIVQERTSQI